MVAVVAVVVALLVAGCGGTDFNSANGAGGQHAKVDAAKVAHAAAVEAAAERPLIAALVASDKASHPGGSAAEAAATRCVATAIVSGYGAATFKTNGITANGLRNPKSNLDALPDPSEGQFTTIGAALQRCHLAVIGQVLAIDFGIADASQIACLNRHLDTDADARRYLVLTALDRHLGLAGAHDAVGIVAACADLATLVLEAANVHVDAPTRACIIDAMNGTSAQLKDYFALKISGADADTAQQAIEAVGVAVNHCRPSAHTGFTVPSG